jgi:hypothetical protein
MFDSLKMLFRPRQVQERRILVLGREKTGTTAISNCVAKTIGTNRYLFEPKRMGALNQMRGKDGVAKLLYEHWADRPDRLRGLVTGRAGPGFDRVIVIVRDPRAALISSVLYSAYDFFCDPQNSGKEAAWIDILLRKQEDPRGVSMEEVMIGLAALAGVNYNGHPPVNGDHIQSWLAFIDSLPAKSHAILRYEDFVSNNLRRHPCRALLGADRLVSPELARTLRTGGADDWNAYLQPQELAYLNDCWKPFLTRFGYPLEVAQGDTIQDAHCAGYVARLIDEARLTLPRAVAEPTAPA